MGVEVEVETTETSDTAEAGGADSIRSGGGMILGVMSPPVMVEIELPEGEEARNDGWGSKRSFGSAVIRLAGLGGVVRVDLGFGLATGLTLALRGRRGLGVVPRWSS